MVQLRKPPGAQSDIQSMRSFYSRIGAMQQYRHCHDVYRKAADTDIIDESVIKNRREDIDRRWANVTLRRLALTHAIDYTKLSSTSSPVPDALRDERVLSELDTFSRLTELERSGAPRSAYASILNNGNRPLALLIKLADYALTHDTENQLEGFISDGKPSPIRRYSSIREAQEAMRMDAKAGETIYAPVAELFGYQELAGDIFLHSFRVNHPEIYKHILSSMTEPVMKEKMQNTQKMVGELAKIISNALRSYGFEAEVTLRREKHDGKKMKKLLGFLTDDYNDSSEKMAGISLADYVSRKVGSFDFERFNDWVAVRAIIRSFRGQSIDTLISAHSLENGDANGRSKGVDISKIGEVLDSITVRPLHLAVKCISDTVSSLGDVFGVADSQTRVAYYEKKNGYRAFHFDTKSEKETVLPFEVQLKTSEWHDIAEHGKAAHYYYLSSDEEHASFVDMIAKAYHDIINPAEKSSPVNGVPSSRRSSPSITPIAGDSTPRRTQ